MPPLGNELASLKPVCAVGHSELHRPFLHACCHRICCSHVECSTIVDDVTYLIIYIGGQVFRHFLTGKHVFGKELAGAILAVEYFDGLLGERLAYNLKPECAGHNYIGCYNVTLSCYTGVIYKSLRQRRKLFYASVAKEWPPLADGLCALQVNIYDGSLLLCFACLIE